jgi:hypothetical protein
VCQPYVTAVEPDKYDKRVDAYVRLPDGRDLGDALDRGRPGAALQRRASCRVVIDREQPEVLNCAAAIGR